MPLERPCRVLPKALWIGEPMGVVWDEAGAVTDQEKITEKITEGSSTTLLMETSHAFPGLSSSLSVS